jgi:hypothetical protein
VGRGRQTADGEGVTSRSPADPSPGFKGWLLVLCAFLAWSVYREGAWLLYYRKGFVSCLSAEVTPFSAFFIGRFLIHVAFVAVLACTIALMVRRRFSFVAWCRAQMMFLMALPVVEAIGVVIWPWEESALAGYGAVTFLVVSYSIVGLLWLRYLQKSKRVAVTFVR